jgi:hypothetical protein
VKVRNAANTDWLDVSTLKIRNSTNTGWVTATNANFKIRNATDTDWISPIPEIGVAITVPVVATSSGFTTILDVSGNSNHQTLSGGTPYGLWVDGPLYPFKGSDGVTRFTVPHSENFMFTVPDWNNGPGWVLSYVYDSPRQSPEGSYNNRHWIFGKYALSDGTVYALAHHEWYQTMKTVDGHPGFNGCGIFNRRWVNAIEWLKSTDNGASWAQKGFGSAADLVVIPEPWGIQSRDTFYGYFHPSNIVKEGSYYYAFVDSRQLRGGTNLLECGFIAIRTDDLERANGWQYWNGSSWYTISPGSYQGGQGANQPYVFFKVTGKDPYSADPGPISMSQSIRYHVPSGMWLLFGSNTGVFNTFCYCASATLANPEFEVNAARSVSLAGGGAPSDYYTYAGRYVSVFDPSSTDPNFERIEGNTAICIVADGGVRYRKQTISIT